MDCLSGHVVEKSPPLFSIKWFKNVATALRFDKYSPRDWAIWNLSSWCSYAVVFGISKILMPLFHTLVALLPAGVVSFFKAVFVKLTLLAVAVWHVVFG